MISEFEFDRIDLDRKYGYLIINSPKQSLMIMSFYLFLKIYIMMVFKNYFNIKVNKKQLS